MDIMELINAAGTVLPIILISYLVGMGLKAWDLFDDRKIPFFMGVVGVLMGIIAYFIAPSVLSVGNIFDAIFKGGASGLAATGINQIIKQARKDE